MILQFCIFVELYRHGEEHFLCVLSGHFLLTNLLLDTMKKTANESNREGRIVIVSSEGHRYAYREGIRFDKINDQAR